ncbi:dynein axonemal assembly factor 6 [Lampetra fluviatilis]
MAELGFSSADLAALAGLLAAGRGSRQHGEDDDDDEEGGEERVSSVNRLGPGDIGPAKKEPKTSATVKPNSSKDIWDEDEVPIGPQYDDTPDHRLQPQYEVLFKQKVGTEDIFLGMGRKDSSTACCEDMLIKVQLPGSRSADIKLDVHDTFLDVRTDTYKLGLHLPHAVHSKEGHARFVSDTQTLELTLPMRREFDFINFS